MLLARWPKLLELCEGDKPLQFNVFLGERGAELLDNVMQFLYTDQLSVFRKFDLETLFEVLEFAQATDFKQLVRACEYTISTRARVDTIAEIKARAASAPPLLAWYIHWMFVEKKNFPLMIVSGVITSLNQRLIFEILQKWYHCYSSQKKWRKKYNWDTNQLSPKTCCDCTQTKFSQIWLLSRKITISKCIEQYCSLGISYWYDTYVQSLILHVGVPTLRVCCTLVNIVPNVLITIWRYQRMILKRFWSSFTLLKCSSKQKTFFH